MLLWRTHQKFTLASDMVAAINHLLQYLHDSANPWEVPLGLVIPREPHFWSRGDASHVGGGAYCPGLGFWFDIMWSPATMRGIKAASSSPGFVHINSLEFLVIILQLAAVHTRLTTMGTAEEARFFPRGRPAIPVWLGETDNSVSRSWENRASARSSSGQNLVGVYAELLRVAQVHTQCQHLAGELNVVADDISRADFSLPFSVCVLQLFQKQPCLASLDYFLPSQELVQLLWSKLVSRPNLEPCVLPRVLGRFVPAGSTISSSVSI